MYDYFLSDLFRSPIKLGLFRFKKKKWFKQKSIIDLINTRLSTQQSGILFLYIIVFKLKISTPFYNVVYDDVETIIIYIVLTQPQMWVVNAGHDLINIYIYDMS